MFQALILGAIQGLTEFVPVSSSAHLVLVPYLLNWRVPTLSFDVAIHLGTALAAVVYFWRDLAAIATGVVRTIARRARDDDHDMVRLAWLLILATIPAAVVGVLFKDFFEEAFQNPPVVALELLGTAALLFVGEAVYDRRGEEGRREMAAIRTGDALVMGALQAAAIVPGISRSGATITGGLLRGLTRDSAARFSFLLSLPAIVGAAIVSLPDIEGGLFSAEVVGATIVSAITGFLAIAFLIRYLRTRSMRPFAWYCVLLSVISLAYFVLTK